MEFVQRDFVRPFCTRPTKDGGSEMCDVLLEVLGCVTKCDRGRGSKLAKNMVTYFMDSPEVQINIPNKQNAEFEEAMTMFAKFLPTCTVPTDHSSFLFYYLNTSKMLNLCHCCSRRPSPPEDTLPAASGISSSILSCSTDNSKTSSSD